MGMSRYASADIEWDDELAVRRAVTFSPEPTELRGRDLLRGVAPRTERDAAGRVRPRADCWPGTNDLW